ncbi:MAG: response regulator [Desulfobacterales bacterium]|nr:response regulator [Desulfobacterales bacterium]
MVKQKEPYILIVDDNSANLQLLGYILREHKFRTAVAKDGHKALELIYKNPPNLILLDIMMPETNGFEVCRQLKADDSLKNIPVIFISALDDTSEKKKGFEAGGVDYISKPFQHEEIITKVKTHMQLRDSQDKLESAYEELEKNSGELESAIRTDPLTKLPNHRDITEKIEYEKIRTQRSRKPFSLLLAVIDDLAVLNNKYGDGCDDFIVVSVAKMICLRLRKQDIVARWKKDEFLVLLPETDPEGGEIVAEFVKQEFSDNYFKYNEHRIKISMAFSVIACSEFENIEQYIEKTE